MKNPWPEDTNRPPSARGSLALGGTDSDPHAAVQPIGLQTSKGQAFLKFADSTDGSAEGSCLVPLIVLSLNAVWT